MLRHCFESAVARAFRTQFRMMSVEDRCPASLATQCTMIFDGRSPAVVGCAEPTGRPRLPERRNSASTISSQALRIWYPPRPRIETPVPMTSDSRGFVDVQSASACTSHTSPANTEIFIDWVSLSDAGAKRAHQNAHAQHENQTGHRATKGNERHGLEDSISPQSPGKDARGRQ